MFNIVNDYGSCLVRIDQKLSTIKDAEFYMKICVDTEVVKNQLNTNFRNYIFNTVNPKVKSYLTNTTLSTEAKYESINFIMMSAILQYFQNKEFEMDDEDLSIISKELNQEDSNEVLEKHFLEKYGEENKEKYLSRVKNFIGPMNFALSVFTNYETAIGKGIITQEHINTFKMLMGKEFMMKAYGEEETQPSSSSSSSSGTKAGCYIATCVYESYDCPEVWCLRRYRDYYLKNHFFGRMFIKIYYSTSPTFVKLFGKTKWFNKIFKPFLDRKIEKLIEKGYSTSPYDD